MHRSNEQYVEIFTQNIDRNDSVDGLKLVKRQKHGGPSFLLMEIHDDLITEQKKKNI